MKNHSTLPFYSLLLVFSFFLLQNNKLVAQDYGIIEFQQKNEISKSNSSKNNSRKRFYDLAFNLHPTHYIENGTLKSTYNFGNPIKMTFEDSKSLSWLKNINSKKSSLELITINLNGRNDLNNKIDLTSDNDFPNLKYVFIKCTFNCTENDIEEFIKVNSTVRIFYTIQKPS
jgi:hypothetical protein